MKVERSRSNPDRGDVYLCLRRWLLCLLVDLLKTAFNRLGLPLLVVDDGPFGVDRRPCQVPPTPRSGVLLAAGGSAH